MQNLLSILFYLGDTPQSEALCPKLREMCDVVTHHVQRMWDP